MPPLLGPLPPTLAILLLLAGPALSEAVTVTIDEASCRQLTRYAPDAEVSADYQSGVDAHGRPVAPADLGGGKPLDLPRSFTFDVEISVFGRTEKRLSQSSLTVGQVTVAPDGRAYFNGQPLQEDEAWELAERCREVSR